jgi:O-antigen ligase
VVTLSASVGIHKISNLVGVAMVGGFLTELVTRNQFSFSQFKIKPFLPLVFLLFIQVIWLLPAPEISARVKTFAQIIVLMCVVFNIVRLTGSTWNVEYGLLIGLAYIWYSGALSFSVDSINDRFEFVLGGERGLNTNVYGMYCCFYILFALRYTFIGFLNHKKTSLSLGRLGIALAGILIAAQQVLSVTGSRKGMIMLALISLGTYFLYTKARFNILRIIPALIAGSLAFAAVIYKIVTGTYFERFVGMFYGLKGEYSGEASFDIRAQMIFNGLEMWFRSPLFGSGNEAFSLKGGFGTYSHSTPIELLANYGILGFIGYYLFLFLAFRYTWSLFRSGNDYLRAYAIWCLLALACVTFWGIFAVCYYEKTVGMVLAVVVGLSHHYSRNSFFGRRYQ